MLYIKCYKSWALFDNILCYSDTSFGPGGGDHQISFFPEFKIGVKKIMDFFHIFVTFSNWIASLSYRNVVLLRLSGWTGDCGYIIVSAFI